MSSLEVIFGYVVKKGSNFIIIYSLSKQHLFPEIFLFHWLKMAPKGPSWSDFYLLDSLMWPLPLLLVPAVPQCSNISFLPDLGSHLFVHVIPSVWKIGTFPAAPPLPPNIWLTFYHPLGLSWDIICSNGLLWPLLRYERSHSSYHNLQQENCSSLGAVVPGIRKTLSIYLRNEWIIAYSYILTSICLAVFFFF